MTTKQLVIICATIVIVAVTIAVGVVMHSRLMVSAGYEEVVLPGRQGTSWQKSKQ